MNKTLLKQLAACLAAVVLIASVAACNPNDPELESTASEVEGTDDLTDQTEDDSDPNGSAENESEGENESKNENESLPDGGVEDSKEESSTADLFEGFERDENGNIVLPDIPISPR